MSEPRKSELSPLGLLLRTCVRYCDELERDLPQPPPFSPSSSSTSSSVLSDSGFLASQTQEKCELAVVGEAAAALQGLKSKLNKKRKASRSLSTESSKNKRHAGVNNFGVNMIL